MSEGKRTVTREIVRNRMVAVSVAAVAVAVAIVIIVIANELRPAPSTDFATRSTDFATRQMWLVGANAIIQMRNAGASPQLIDRAFNNGRTYVYSETYINQDVPSTIGIPTADFRSYQGIRRAFADGTLPGRFKAVIYDNEHWAWTPLAEQRNPIHYETLAAQLLHRHGLTYIATPTSGVMSAVNRPDDPFLGTADTARYADIIDIQAQHMETNLPEFARLASAAAEKARKANRHVKILVGIRTNSGNAVLYAAYKAASHIGDGCWLNVNGIPGPAVYLLRRVYRMP